ncbi:LysR family transcriptional regulator [Erythrobacter sp. F6033]|uniref:LysR family transcriptional regulator n=1 Tax=Erythrobacter sp. F6033 TaxID=2926401 RepID=UPI001FF19DCB|nr:LysR family transcriptional regulator [Erythrobacter sp. F6033]MCK0127811.1 LysR family transcriptional regulator [Erythrobacter sp. F6033]
MEDWDDYRLILSLARSGSLRAAAADMGLTHTTVSRRLAVLQDTRGLLFEKSPGGYAPTTLGSALIEVAERIESLTLAGQRHQRAADQDISGVITLSLPEAIAQYLLLEDLIEFSQVYPAIDLRVETSYRFVDLDRSEADVVVRGAQEPPEHLVGRRLFPNRVTYYGNRDYLNSTPEDELIWIAPNAESRTPGWLENSPYPNAPIGLAIDDITARHRALVMGLGLSRGACFMADPEPSLVRLTADAPDALQDIWVLTHPDLRDTPRIRVLMDFIVKAMTEKKALVSGDTGLRPA